MSSNAQLAIPILSREDLAEMLGDDWDDVMDNLVAKIEAYHGASHALVTDTPPLDDDDLPMQVTSGMQATGQRDMQPLGLARKRALGDMYCQCSSSVE